jgi:hypothetical protein
VPFESSRLYFEDHINYSSFGRNGGAKACPNAAEDAGVTVLPISAVRH